MNTPEELFLRAIEENPEKVSPKESYSDWLEEHRDPKASLIRNEILASGILGHENVHGILDLERCFGRDDHRLKDLAHLPFPSTEILEQCKDHVLALCAGHAPSEFHYAEKDLELELMGRPSPQSKRLRWSLGHRDLFPYTWGTASWLLFPKNPFMELFDHTFSEQEQLLRQGHPEYRIMTGAELVSVLLVHFDATKEWLLSTFRLRCSDMSAPRDRVYVGIDGFGINVSSCWAGNRLPDIGLAACRKF